MMRTEHDIRDALDAKAAEATDRVDLPVGQPTSRRPSLRRAAPILGAVAIAVPLVATSHKSTSTARSPGTGCGAPATESTTLRYDFRVDGPPRFRFSLEAICSQMQQLAVRFSDEPPDTIPLGSVTVFPKGAFDPSAGEKGRPVSVQGHPGYFAPLPVVGGLSSLNRQGGVTLDPHTGIPVPPKSQPALVWQYAPGSWAVVQASWSNNPLADMQLIADHVRIGEHQQLPMPFKLGWVPDGLVVGGAQDMFVGLSDGTPAKSADCTTASCGSAMSVGVYGDHEPDAPHAPGTHRLTIDGRVAIIYPNASELDVGFGDRTLWIRVDPNHVGKFSDQDLIKIAQHVTMSPNMTDRSTWFDATDVVPH